MKIDWSKVAHTIALGWFYARSHLTKALGILAVAVGYGIENQAQFVALLTQTQRGVVLKYFGIAVFLLGIYNQFFKPKPPVAPGSPS